MSRHFDVADFSGVFRVPHFFRGSARVDKVPDNPVFHQRDPLAPDSFSIEGGA